MNFVNLCCNSSGAEHRAENPGAIGSNPVYNNWKILDYDEVTRFF